MIDLADLLARVKEATGPDRELDAQIGAALGAETSRLKSGLRMRHAPWLSWSGTHWHDLPRWTASVDEALDLVERLIPGTLHASGSMEDGPFCRLVTPPIRKRGVPANWGYCNATASTPPLAILSALLTALIAQHSTHPHMRGAAGR